MKTCISVLIIDDDPDICSLFESFFKPLHLSTISVNTLREAAIKLDKFIPAFIILDNSLPDGKGIDFINYIANNCPGVKIVVCSADNLEEELKSRATKVHLILKKPFMFKELLPIVNNMISAPILQNDIQGFSKNG